MMNQDVKRDYRFLDSEADRRALIDDIKRVRRDVLRVVDMVPADKWYEPRYHGWSLAAMLGHLQLMDSLNRKLIQFGTMGISFPVSAGMLNTFNDFMARVFKQRMIETTIKGLEKGETAIAALILHLPMDKFSKLVYDPALKQYLTVEQAVQELFLYHWLWHLADMRKVDGLFYEPPTNTLLM